MKNYVQRKQKASDEYATPQDLFDGLNEEFHFDLDPCSTHENAKCERHYTIDDDGLSTQDEDGLSRSWGVQSVLQPTVFGHTDMGREMLP